MTTRRHPFHRSRRTLGLASVLALGCGLPDKNLGEISGTTGEGNDSHVESTDDGVSGQADATAGSETGESDGDPVGCVDADVNQPECHEDEDRDNIRFGCDNAPDHFNPDQADLDDDSVGDVADLCPVVASANNTADSDQDGVGNDCDVCRQTLAQYNMHDNAVSVPDFMFVRSIPWQGDADEDGIGDVCDNCVARPNCEDYGPDNPFEVGDPIQYDNRPLCQTDDDQDLVGDACAGDQGEGAAGPVGLGANDDFDQDGLTNTVDACPRQPVPERIACTGPSDCPTGSDCEGDVCDHLDSDGDGVGDICDTCPVVANPDQAMDGVAQAEDEDGDFVGVACETNAACSSISDPRPLAFHQVSVNGQCCTVQLVEDDSGELLDAATQQPLRDPDGLPIRVDCDESEDPEQRTCRRLPSDVANAPGVLTAPPGCDAALADAGTTATTNPKLGLDDVGDSYDALWNSMCTLPQWDQDFDSLGDRCDLCPFMYDPDNLAYVDDDGIAWPDAGKYCNGAYSPDAICGG